MTEAARVAAVETVQKQVGFLPQAWIFDEQNEAGEGQYVEKGRQAKKCIHNYFIIIHVEEHTIEPRKRMHEIMIKHTKKIYIFIY